MLKDTKKVVWFARVAIVVMCLQIVVIGYMCIQIKTMRNINIENQVEMTALTKENEDLKEYMNKLEEKIAERKEEKSSFKDKVEGMIKKLIN